MRQLMKEKRNEEENTHKMRDDDGPQVFSRNAWRGANEKNKSRAR
jgi:hypothetical protein